MFVPKSLGKSRSFKSVTNWVTKLEQLEGVERAASDPNALGRLKVPKNKSARFPV